jgi:hypothetical protein
MRVEGERERLWARAEEQYLLDIIGHDSKKYQNIIPRK